MYRLAQHHLRRTQSWDERAAYLELTAHEQQASHVIAAFRALTHHNPWRVLWARTRPRTPHRVIEGHQGGVTAVALGERRDGRRVIVSGGLDRTLRVWDLDSGQLMMIKATLVHTVGLCRGTLVLGTDSGLMAFRI